MDDASDYYGPQAPDRAEVAALRGPAVIEFGTNWCGYCLAARPFVEQALAAALDRIHATDAEPAGDA